MSWFASPPAPPPAEGPSIFALAAVIGTLAFLFVVADVLDRVYESAKPVAATADRFAAAAAASASVPPAYPSWWPRRLRLPSDGTFALLCAFWGALALRCAVALWGHSGQNAPPMFGDFEAQRHWMEVTVNLPPTAWYVDGRDNDLQYWGLDYPPLSAHLSWLIGKVALHGGRPELVALHASRGLETAEAKTFMRRSVQLCDALVYLPAALAHGVAAVRGRHRWLPLLQLVLLPALVLVDHGHFQYNCVSLGLALWAFTAALRGRPLACAFCFTLALNFKQMSLYLAPAIFCYLLAGCLRAATKTAAALRVARLGTVVLATTALCWAPFLGSWADARAVLVRVFPVGRHLYEDKVASVWCTLALTPLKLKNLLSIPTLVRLTLGVTLAALGPPCAMLLARPSRAGFLLGATACALAFFLFSFQVHEKHVLLPLLPAALLAPRCPTAFGWLAAVASFSMYPMLKRDGDPWSLRLPYAVTQLLFTALSLDPAAFGLPAPPAAAQLPTPLRWPLRASLAGMAALHAADLLVAPPARYPDLHAALFAAYACVHLGCAYLAALYAQWRLAATEPPHTPFDDARADVPLLSGAKEE